MAMMPKIRVGTIPLLPKKFNPIKLLESVCCHSLMSPVTSLDLLRPMYPRMTVTKRNPMPVAIVRGSAIIVRAWEVAGSVEQHSMVRSPLGEGTGLDRLACSI